MSAGPDAALLPVCRFGQWLAFALRLDFDAAYSRLQFQQLQLRIVELLAGRPILGDQLQSQALFENLDF